MVSGKGANETGDPMVPCLMAFNHRTTLAISQIYGHYAEEASAPMNYNAILRIEAV
jgi:hypothetical protein